MFRYYKILFGYNRLYLAHESERLSFQLETPSPTKKTTAEWQKSQLVAWTYLTQNLQEKEYRVYVRENKTWNWLIDIKIDDAFWNPIIYGVPERFAQKAVDEFMKLDLTTIRDKKLVWRNSRIELMALSEDVNQLDYNNLITYKRIFDQIMADAKISPDELKNINYNDLKNILNKSFSQENPSPEFNQARVLLLNSIDHTIVEYDNMNKKWNTLVNRDFENLRTFRHTFLNNIVNKWVSEGISFVETLENMSLAQLLEQYNTQDEWTRYIVLQKIIDKFVTWSQNFLAYWENWEIIIKSSKIDNWKKIVWLANDNNSNAILSKVLQEDLKWIMLRDIIKSLWINVWKENIDYQLVISKIFSKYNLDWFTPLDVINRPEELKNAIIQKLETTNNLNTKRDLSFVLDYINNQNAYPTNMIQESAARSLLAGSSYDPNSNKWIERLKQAARKWEFIKTVLNDVRWSYGWATWALIMIWTIVWLFLPKWRKYSIWSLLLQIFWPAWEELFHKWWWGTQIEKAIEGWQTNQWSWNSQWNTNNTSSWFEVQNTSDIDINISYLPQNYTKKYNEMYRKNLKKSPEERIYEWDFAQIFAQLSKNPDVKKMSIKEVNKKLTQWTPVWEILWQANLPKTYVENLIQSKSWKKLPENRSITQKDVEKFMTLLLDVWEKESDEKIWDLFAEWKDAISYVDNEVFQSENREIYDLVSDIPFWEARTEVEKVLWETQWFLINLVTNSNENKKIKIDEIIKKLEWLKTKYSNVWASIWAIILKYEKISSKLDQSIRIEKWTEDANAKWGLNTPLEFVKDMANKWIEAWSKLVVYLKLSPWSTTSPFWNVTPEKLNSLISDWKKLLTEAWITEEQKKGIKETIRKLREKKLAILREEDSNNLSLNWWMSTETKAELNALIKENETEYSEMIKSIVLKLKPESESLESYSQLFIQNAGNIIFLKSIVDSQSSLSNIAWLKLKDYYDTSFWYEANLKTYLETKKAELTDINKSLESATTIDNVSPIRDQFENFKTEFVSKNYFGDFLENLWIVAGTNRGNSIIDFQTYYKKILNTNINLEWEDFGTELDETNNAISQKISSLIDRETLPSFNWNIYKNEDINMDAINTFIESAKTYKEKISKFGDSHKGQVNAKLGLLSWKIRELEQKFINSLGTDWWNSEQIFNNSLSNNAKLNDYWWQILESLDWLYDSKSFAEEYENKMIYLYISRIKSRPDLERLIDLRQNVDKTEYKNENGIKVAFEDKTLELYSDEIKNADTIEQLITIKDKYGVKSSRISKSISTYLFEINSEKYAKKFKEKMWEMKINDIYTKKADIFSEFDTFIAYNWLNGEISDIFTAKFSNFSTIMNTLINWSPKFASLSVDQKTEIKDIVKKIEKDYEAYIASLLSN